MVQYLLLNMGVQDQDEIPPHLQWCADGATNFSSTAA
jgi:hypothetical protein